MMTIGAVNAVAASRRGPAKRFVKAMRSEAVYLLALAAKALGERLPRRQGLRLFEVMGRFFFLLPGRNQKRTLTHLRLIFGDRWSEERIRQTAAAVYGELAKNLFDAVHLATLDDERFLQIVRAEGAEELLQTNACGRGMIVVTAHLGCFEAQLDFFGRAGVNGFVIGRRLFDRRIDAMVRAKRSRGAIGYLYRSDNPRTMIRMLQQGKAMGVLIDQDTRTSGVFAHFLGRLAYTPSGPVRLAMQMGLPLFVTTTVRQSDNTHLISVTNPIPLDNTGNRKADLLRNVERINSLLSQRILANPEQWVWMHRRWRRKPQDAGMENIPSIEQTGY